MPNIKSWDDVVFDPAQFVKDMEELVDHYKGKKKLSLRTFRVVRPAPQFTPAQIVKLRRQQKLSRLRMARILNVPDVTVRKWETGKRKPTVLPPWLELRRGIHIGRSKD